MNQFPDADPGAIGAYMRNNPAAASLRRLPIATGPGRRPQMMPCRVRAARLRTSEH